jgi:hypothetical protein
MQQCSHKFVCFSLFVRLWRGGWLVLSRKGDGWLSARWLVGWLVGCWCVSRRSLRKKIVLRPHADNFFWAPYEWKNESLLLVSPFRNDLLFPASSSQFEPVRGMLCKTLPSHHSSHQQLSSTNNTHSRTASTETLKRFRTSWQYTCELVPCLRDRPL